MKPGYWVVIGLGVLGFLYYRHAKNAAANLSPVQSENNGLYSVNNGIGTIFNTWTQDPITGQVSFPYARATGPVETYTTNPIMTTYQNYLTTSTSQSVPFETYLTQAQAMGLPVNQGGTTQ